MSKAKLVAAARRKWGTKAYVSENRRAPTARQRAEATSKAEALKIVEADLIERLRNTREHWAKLLKAARFFLDVNGDPPSRDDFVAAVDTSEQIVALEAERAAVHEERRQLRGHNARRWSVGHIVDASGIRFASVGYEGDTIEEVLAKLDGGQS